MSSVKHNIRWYVYTGNGTDKLMQGIVAGMRDHLDGRNYNPGVDVCAANVDWLDGYSYGWNTAHAASQAHPYSVRRIGSHGYPYRAVCPCGWQSNTYAAAHAAHSMAGEHVAVAAMETYNRANRAK